MKFAITIEGRVIKTIEVEADTEEKAIEVAHGEFTVVPDGEPEKYTEHLLKVEQL